MTHLEFQGHIKKINLVANRNNLKWLSYKKSKKQKLLCLSFPLEGQKTGISFLCVSVHGNGIGVANSPENGVEWWHKLEICEKWNRMGKLGDFPLKLVMVLEA